MKIKNSILLLTMTVLLAGCGPSDPPTPTTESSPAATDLKTKVQEATAATKEAVTETKDQFVASLNAKVAELDRRIAELAAKSEGYKDDAKVQADQALTALKEQRARLNEKFETFKQSSANTWQDMKAGLAAAVDELEKAYDNAKAKFN